MIVNICCLRGDRYPIFGDCVATWSCIPGGMCVVGFC